MRNLLLFVMALCALPLAGQQAYPGTPPPAAAYISTNGNIAGPWNPLVFAAGTQAYSGTPGAAALYYSSTGNIKGPWYPCTLALCFGSGSGLVNSGTANQLAYYATTGTAVSGTNAIPNGTTATTQPTGDNSNDVATDAFVLANGGGASGGQPGFCTTSQGNQLCLTDTTYNASGAGATTTTVSGTWTAGTSGSVASCSTFSANQGVFIAGAGAAAANYIGTVVSCSGTTMTVTPATSTTVSSSNAVRHDESAAFQSAMNHNSTSSKTIWLNDGVYRINGPLQDTGGANGIVIMPQNPINDSLVTKISGFTTPTTETTTGAIILTDSNAGSIFSGFCSFCGQQNITFAGLEFDDVVIRVPNNPSITAINGFDVATLRLHEVQVDTGSSGGSTLPTTGTGAGVLFPAQGNNVRLNASDFTVSGFAICVQTNEHVTITDLWTANCINAIVPESRSGAPVVGNTQYIVHAWDQQSTNVVAAGAHAVVIRIDTLDLETTGTHGINDPSNLLFGEIGFSVFASAGAITPTNPAVNGGANLCITNIQFPNGATFGGSCPSSLAVANTTITVGSSVSFAANTCSSYTGTANTASTTAVANLTTGMTVNHTPTIDIKGVTGWGPGAGGQLYFQPWPSAGTLNDYVCNPTGSAIVTGSSTTWNVGAK